MKKSIFREIEKIGELRLAKDTTIAEMFEFPVQTLRNNRSKGVGFPYVKIGRSVRYDLAEVRAYIEKHRIKVKPFSEK